MCPAWSLFERREDFCVLPSQLNYCALCKTTFTRPGKESKTERHYQPPCLSDAERKVTVPFPSNPAAGAFLDQKWDPGSFPVTIRGEIGRNAVSTECSPKGGITLLPPGCSKSSSHQSTAGRAVAHCRQCHPPQGQCSTRVPGTQLPPH